MPWEDKPQEKNLTIYLSDESITHDFMNDLVTMLQYLKNEW